jgi:hypothetical protein
LKIQTALRLFYRYHSTPLSAACSKFVVTGYVAVNSCNFRKFAFGCLTIPVHIASLDPTELELLVSTIVIG